ncbi:MAG: sulfatase-like hydrolase/transferase [Pirellulales bacterium]|nr:sulfatase-like hydrolase/transferase [Pirellulales bacterium]
MTDSPLLTNPQAGPPSRCPQRSLMRALRAGVIALVVCHFHLSPIHARASDEAIGKPNIILIMADDIGYECYGCYGSKQYRTPNIDRLAAEGMRFEHCYSQPLCTPSRVKIMTGISNVRNYAAFSILNRDQRTFGHHLQDAGYKTFVGGKWQLLGAEHYGERFRGKGSWPTAMGFDQCCLWQVDRLGDRFWNPLLHIEDKNRQFDRQDYGPDIVTDHILKFMEENRAERFFVYYPMILVHNPFLTTPDSQSPNSRDKQRNFEDMVQYMDKLIGDIVAKTEQLGIAKDTLILVTGDNGTNKAIRSKLGGRTIRGGKGQMTDAGTRVALVAYQPGTVPAGVVNRDLIDFSDFVPTLQDIAGAPIPDGLDGISFAPQLRGKSGPTRDWMYCYYNPRPEKTKPQRFVRDQRWKLYGDGRFFDVENDPHEKYPLKQRNEAWKKLSAAMASMPDEGQSLLKFVDP